MIKLIDARQFLEVARSKDLKEIEEKLIEVEEEFNNQHQKVIDDRASAKNKLKNLGLSDDEIKALMGV